MPLTGSGTPPARTRARHLYDTPVGTSPDGAGMVPGPGVPLIVMLQDDDAIESAIRQVLAGDIGAFSAVIAAHEQRVWRVVAQVLCSRDETEELVQRVFIQAYEQLDRYEAGTDFGAWIVTLARNLARNHVRDRSRERRHLGVLREYLLRQLGDDRSWEREERDLLEALVHCRAALDEPARELLRLHYEEALTLQDIAGRLDRSPSGVERLLVRVRGLLRDCIQGRMAGT
jgi:RNA polymerase sigma-70 factor (ECF subfamily)